MDHKALAAMLFPGIKETIPDLEAKYPARDLPEGTMVTRFAPSPTGYLHIGAVFGALCDVMLARRSGGTVILRIEDTDAKREVEGAADIFVRMFPRFGIKFDEGAVVGGERGAYGPYFQSKRADIYHICARRLVEQGLAYPCFCTEDELTAMRTRQEAEKATPGYYGKWARCRQLDMESIRRMLREGKPYVLRLRSRGDPAHKYKIRDAIKGQLEFPENDQDIVLLKSDGIPTYHFAHAVDDHFMRVTHVVRGDEWLSSLPIHVQLFDALGFKKPVYCHTAAMLKQDGDGKRKISKRKDPEADMSYYISRGYPSKGIIEYVLTLLNSNYEDWRRENPCAPVFNFPFSLKKMSVSGALFDMSKFSDICHNVIARMTAEEVYNQAAEWAGEFAPSFYKLFTRDPDYSKAILNIGRGGAKPRRDYGEWSELPDYMSFFFEETYKPGRDFPENMTRDNLKTVFQGFCKSYDRDDGSDVWFSKLKTLSSSIGFAPDTKTFRKNPGVYRGHVGDISMALRVAVTGRRNAPDLCSVMQILGQDRVIARVKNAVKNL